MDWPSLPPQPEPVSPPISEAPLQEHRTARIVGADGKVWYADASRGGSDDAFNANDYSFRMTDASVDGLAQVLIQDGFIWAPNNADGVLPSGMGGGNYVLPVSDGDEIWVEVDWSGTPPSLQTVVSASLNHGASTPSDTETTKYYTIGYVAVDSSGTTPVVTCVNQICGDIIIEVPPFPDSGKFVIMADNGDLIWQETEECGCDAAGFDDGGP